MTDDARDRKFGFYTLALHAGQRPDPTTGARAVPIYQTTSYVFEDTDDAASLFALQRFGNIYTRIMNPTTAVFEERMAALEGGVGGLATASGHAAQVIVAATIMEAGDHFVSASTLYGGSYTQFSTTFKKLGLEVTFVEPDEPENFRRAVRPNTKMVFGETVSNPRGNVLDLEAVAKIAHDAGVPFVVDNTFASPYLQQPLALGADLVLHSTTKYIGGHSDVVGGAVVGNDPHIYESMKFNQNAAGAVPGPFDCWLTLRGIKTLAVRMERHSENGMAVAEFLANHPAIEKVYYPGLPSHEGHEIAARQMRSFAGMVSFTTKGGYEVASKVVAKTKLFALAESLGGVESLIEHPGKMTHASVAGTGAEVEDSLVRLSVGIEHVDDLINDLRQALDAAVPSLTRR
jgi:cystathionine gamma-synthase